MNKLSFAALALVAATAATSAFADDMTPDTLASTVSTKTRVQVIAERNQALRDGSTKVWSTSYNPLAVAKTTTTRGAVRAEERAARSAGTLNAMYGEDSGSFALARGRAVTAGSVVASK